MPHTVGSTALTVVLSLAFYALVYVSLLAGALARWISQPPSVRFTQEQHRENVRGLYARGVSKYVGPEVK